MVSRKHLPSCRPFPSAGLEWDTPPPFSYTPHTLSEIMKYQSSLSHPLLREGGERSVGAPGQCPLRVQVISPQLDYLKSHPIPMAWPLCRVRSCSLVAFWWGLRRSRSKTGLDWMCWCFLLIKLDKKSLNITSRGQYHFITSLHKNCYFVIILYLFVYVETLLRVFNMQFDQ